MVAHQSLVSVFCFFFLSFLPTCCRVGVVAAPIPAVAVVAPQAAIVCLKAFILSTMKPHNLAAVTASPATQTARVTPHSPLLNCAHGFDVMIYCGCACSDLHPLLTDV